MSVIQHSTLLWSLLGFMHKSTAAIAAVLFVIFIQDIAAAPVASIIVASIMKLNTIWVSFTRAVNKWVYFSGLRGGMINPEFAKVSRCLLSLRA